ncbi:MAG: hypothetical protein JNG89_07925 [Planctomycetaceae bacterium]|nr:hypothetical protein [Planctomycetaceae bacterium]
MFPSRIICSTLLIVVLALLRPTAAQDAFEAAPVSYSESTPENCISRLQARLDSGDASLSFDDRFGYLPAVLTALDVPVESQALVFSKTSLQLRRISPRTPRAIYFNDEVYVGFCQSGDVLEVSTSDPQLGAVFYTLSQRAATETPKFARQTDNCLICHSSSRTDSVPGHLVRSLHVDKGGHPLLSAGSRNVNHTTPISERWGGWYVTGEHGDQKHLGNLICDNDVDPEQADNANGQNVTSLGDRFHTERYLSPHSDIVSLMILEHQVLVHNRLTNANFATRQALAYDATMNRMLEKPGGERLESTTRRIHNAGDKLVEALLLVDEAPITAAIRGTSGYAEVFSGHSARDPLGRSLRDLDLTRRLFRYPCSPLIYSASFAALPDEVRIYVWERMQAILSGADQSEVFAHLSAEDRQAIAEILRATLPEAAERL